MLRSHLLAICTLLVSTTAWSQTDTAFWFAAPDLQGAHGDRPIILRMSTGAQAAQVVISQPANPTFTPTSISIPANTSQSVDLTAQIDLVENTLINTVENKGLYIQSSSTVSCYYDIANTWNGDIWALKGNNALGFNFTLPFQRAFSGGGFPSYSATFSIVASEDNTIVQITPSNDLTGHPAGIMFSVTLNRGQTYTCQAATSNPALRPGGTKVSSNKRIAISTKDDSINYPGNGCADTAGDQLIPDCNAGKEFAIVRGYFYGSDYYYVYAISPNTTVKLNGTTVATLNAGGYYQGTLSDPSCYIETSLPAHVFHVSGFGCEVGGAVVPALSASGSSSINMTRATSQNFFLNVLAPSNIVSAFSINGSTTVLQASDFSAVPSTNGNWMAARLDISSSVVGAGGSLRIVNGAGKFHAGFIHGDQSSTTRYGYFSDFEQANIQFSNYDTLFCLNDSVGITASSNEAFDFVWTHPDGSVHPGPDLIIPHFQQIHEGVYTLSANTIRCGRVERKVRIRIQTVQPQFIVPAPQCFTGNSFTFQSNSTALSGNVVNVSWQFGDGTTGSGSPVTHPYPRADRFAVKLIATSNKGCIDSITQFVEVLAEPIVSINTTGPSSFCQGSSVDLIANALPGSGIITGYQWFNGGVAMPGETGTQLTATTSGNYSVQVTNSNTCRNQSSAQAVIVYPLPTGQLQLPPSNILCDGYPVTLQATGGAQYQWYLNGTLIPGATTASYSAAIPGSYEVDLISANGCRRRAVGQVGLVLYKKPSPEFQSPLMCINRPIQFQNLSDIRESGNVQWNWNFGDQTQSTQFSPTHSYGQSGPYTVTLTVTPEVCPALAVSISKQIRVEAPRPAVRYPAVNALANQPKLLRARDFGMYYSWAPPSGLNNPRIVNPTFQHILQTDYQIRIETANGCVTVDSQLVRIFKNIDIFVPKAFSPNGDGHNDRLDIFLVGIGELKYFRVFNRWGQLLYETHDPAQLWDGNYKGVRQPLETYVWTAEGIGEDGTKVVRRGQTVLIK